MNDFVTEDLAFAATLEILGYPCYKCTKGSGVRMKFVFDAIPEIDEISKKFWKNELRVEPISFSLALRKLKSMVHANRP